MGSELAYCQTRYYGLVQVTGRSELTMRARQVGYGITSVTTRSGLIARSLYKPSGVLMSKGAYCAYLGASYMPPVQIVGRIIVYNRTTFPNF